MPIEWKPSAPLVFYDMLYKHSSIRRLFFLPPAFNNHRRPSVYLLQTALMSSMLNASHLISKSSLEDAYTSCSAIHSHKQSFAFAQVYGEICLIQCRHSPVHTFLLWLTHTSSLPRRVRDVVQSRPTISNRHLNVQTRLRHHVSLLT